LVLYQKVLLQAAAHYGRARRRGVYAKNCKLRFSQPPDFIAAPAASFKQLCDFAQPTIRRTGAEGFPERVQILEEDANQHQ
jgi:hypothetical protein